MQTKQRATKVHKEHLKSFRLSTRAVEIIDIIKNKKNWSESDVIEIALQLIKEKIENEHDR